MSFIQRLFSLNWLTSKERAELEALRAEKLKEQVRKEILVESIKETPLKFTTERPYSNLYFTGTSVTVVLNNGDVLTGDCNIDKYEAIRNAITEDSIKTILYVMEEKPKNSPFDKIDSPEERAVVSENLRVLKENPDFEIKEDNVYLKGVGLAIPSVVLGSFIEILEKKEILTDDESLKEKYEALKMFWCKLALNPIDSSRSDLMNFVKNNSVRLTNTGNLILYRRAVAVKEVDPIVEFVTKEYFRVKKWKKSPKNYNVYDDGGLICVHNDRSDGLNNFKGTLEELYLEIPNMEKNHLTDAHTRKMTIKIGSVYSIPEEEVDIDSRQDCSSGLHVACRTYNYGSFGDTPLLCIVNPSKVRSVPLYDGGKMRVSEMFVAAVLEVDENGQYIDEDVDVVAFDEQYHNYSLEELLNAVEGKTLQQFDCQTENTKVSLSDAVNIVEILKNRTTVVV